MGYNKLCKQKIVHILCMVCLLIIARIVPHLPNSTPLLAISCYVGSQYRKVHAAIIILFMVFLSDIILSLYSGYALFGVWMIFCYSGYIGCGLIATKLKLCNHSLRYICITVALTFGYWVWSNLGVWLLTTMYAHSWAGFGVCYILALPFLGYAIMGSFFWSIAIVLAHKISLFIARSGQTYQLV